MSSQTAAIEQGKVFIPADAPWLEDYLYELATFPHCRFFDQVDSTSQALRWIQQPDIKGYAYLQIAERANRERARAQDIWVVKSPGSSHFGAMDGTQYTAKADGTFHIRADHAQTIVGKDGWEKIGVLDISGRPPPLAAPKGSPGSMEWAAWEIEHTAWVAAGGVE